MARMMVFQPNIDGRRVAYKYRQCHRYDAEAFGRDLRLVVARNQSPGVEHSGSISGESNHPTCGDIGDGYVRPTDHCTGWIAYGTHDAAGVYRLGK